MAAFGISEPPIVLHWAFTLTGLFFMLAIAILLRADFSGGFLLVPIYLFGLAFAIHTYVLDVPAESPCTSPAAYAASISRVSASIWPEGYVFMFVYLTFIAYMLLDKISVLELERHRLRFHDKLDRFDDKEGELGGHRSHKDQWCDKLYWCEKLMRWGVVLTTLSAVLPDAANDCVPEYEGDWNTCKEYRLSQLHTSGIGGGVLISMVGAFMHALMTAGRIDRDKVRNRAWVVRSLVWLSCVMALAFTLLFFLAPIIWPYRLDPHGLTGEAHGQAKLVHICSRYETKATCQSPEHWRLHLDLTQNEWNHTGALPGWNCMWDETSTSSTKFCTVECDKDNLYTRQFKIVCEFLMLIFWQVALIGSVMIIEKQTLWYNLDEAASEEEPTRTELTVVEPVQTV